MIEKAVSSPVDGEHVIDMDAVAQAAGKDVPKPPFYYVDEKQQNQFSCQECGAKNDILGKYGYCSSCGATNGAQNAESEINELRRTMAGTVDYSQIVKQAVSIFDSYARYVSKQLVANVPMTEGRKKQWTEKLFHNLSKTAAPLKDHFDIDLLHGLKPDDIDFSSKMFLRRHLYEHNGGEVDQRYLDESGDAEVRLKQSIRETKESATRTCDLVLRMARNIHAGFHNLFPLEERPVKIHQEEKERRRGRGAPAL